MYIHARWHWVDFHFFSFHLIYFSPFIHYPFNSSSFLFRFFCVCILFLFLSFSQSCLLISFTDLLAILLHYVMFIFCISQLFSFHTFRPFALVISYFFLFIFVLFSFSLYSFPSFQHPFFCADYSVMSYTWFYIYIYISNPNKFRSYNRQIFFLTQQTRSCYKCTAFEGKILRFCKLCQQGCCWPCYGGPAGPWTVWPKTPYKIPWQSNC